MNPLSDKRRYRLSDRLSGTLPAKFEGLLDRRFYPYFDYLLDSQHSPEEQSDFYEVYVNNPEIEEKLRRRVSSPTTHITALTGARGIGKSTTLRYFFGVSTQPKLKSLKEIFPGQTGRGVKTVIVPFYLDTYGVPEGGKLSDAKIRSILTSQIQAAAELIYRTYNVEVSDEELFDFINTHKSQLVTFPELGLKPTPRARIERFRSADVYAYTTELLKFGLHNSDIERVILIVDDIESCSFESQKNIVKGIMRLRDCLKNFGDLPRTYVPDYIFTCRPATFNLLKSHPEVDGYSIGHSINFNKPASIAEVVSRRFDYAKKVLGEGRAPNAMGTLGNVKNLETWREAYRAFEAIINSVASVNEAFIANLCNHDLRRALIDLQGALRNSRWYERETHSQGAFKITEDKYNFSTAGIIRAFVLRENEYYSEEVDTVLPNLFFNHERDEIDLMVLHILKFCFEQTRSKRITAIPLSRISDALKIPYRVEVVKNHFDEVLDYMISTEIVRQEMVKMPGDRTRMRYIIPMNKGFALWRACRSTSVFLEFFRDNTFMFHNSVGTFQKGRTIGTSRLDSEHKFIFTAEFISEVAGSESKIYRFINKYRDMQKYREVFGTRFISRPLLWGFRDSLRRHYGLARYNSDLPTDVKIALSRAERDVSRVKR
ncbi:hypothetical protein KQ247_14870 [Ruegeria pomeroyi]|nr:hypothetical protein [Ruegeria pomeroyi]NVK99292.1 hypothetical protein [Ruegeria pomeroyi]NVL01444.1 hypothetical protein [Ruegeria pomeroyi]QWV08099.1 hypothetical protein KQ247_14870 [Ruegeria pomeroyi]